MRRIDYIVIHCSAGFGDVAAIRRFWREVRGWKSDGYHRFILTNGEIVHLMDIAKVSNGVLGYNSNSVHICYQGGVDRKNVNVAIDTRTPEQKESILQAINEVLIELKKIQPVDHIKILGHRDFSPDKNGNGLIESWERIKECPSFNAIDEYWWIQGSKALNKKGIL